MDQIQKYLTESELALAAYANLDTGALNTQRDALIEAGFSPSQATGFANNWRVVDQKNDIVTGLSATVLEEITTGTRSLAIRGTQGPTDFVADYFILTGIPSQLNPQYLSIKARVQAWLSDGTLTSGFTVTGHSLGGYLAAGLVADFSAAISHAWLYNTPGNNSLVSQIMQALGIAATPDAAKITSLRADAGLSPIAALGNDFSPPIRIAIENQFLSDVSNPPAARNHSQQVLTDALALYGTLARLSPGLTVESIGQLFKTASRQNKLTLESAVDALRILLLGKAAVDLNPTAEGNRESFYQNLFALEESTGFQVLKDNAVVHVLVDQSAETLASTAKSDFGHFLAVHFLVPVAIEGAHSVLSPVHPELFSQWDSDQVKRAAGSPDLAFTDAYLADRAEMLSWKNLFYQKDGNVALRGNRTETLQFTDKSIKDDRTGQDLTLTVVGRNSRQINNPAKIIFGGDADETLVGGNVAAGDHLYGGGGADTLQGNQGNDYLEGGSGNDTYVWSTGDGFDTILDTDGVGRLVVNGRIVSGGIKVAQNDYVSSDKQTLHFEGDPVTGGVLLVNGDLRIENFASGDLGIVLNDQGSVVEIQSTVTTFYGPFATGTGFGTEGPDHYIASAGSFFTAKGGDDLLEGEPFSYFDGFLGDAGDDVLIGQGLVSLLGGGSGRDTILGGPGSDQLFGDFLSVEFGAFRFSVDLFEFFDASDTEPRPRGYFSNNFWPEGPDKDMFFPGGYFEALRYVLGLDETTDLSTHYDDYLDGGDESDLIVGGFGSDVLFGGAGDDSIDGGGFWANIDPQWNFDELWRDSIAHLFGRPGDDYLDGGPGDDQLVDQDGGNDMLIGGDGNDVLTSYDPPSAESYVNYLFGGEGEDRLLSENLSANGFDVLVGGPGNDNFTVQSGSAYLEGGPGNDIYSIRFSLDTRAVINDHDDGTGGSDRLALSFPDLPTSEPIRLSITRDEWNLYLGAGGARDLVTIENWFADAAYKIVQITTEQMVIVGGQAEGDGGSFSTVSHTLDVAAIESRFSTPTAAADFLWGSSADEQLAGGLGNDTLFGGAGKDTLAGNEGSDTLDGGEDADVYAFNIGDGVDHIRDTGSIGADVIAFGPTIMPDMLTLSLGSLLIKVGGDGDAIHIEGFDPNNALESGSIELFQFADGTQLTYGELIACGFDIAGTEADDLLQGTSVSDRISGGAGSDTYFFGRGSGQDVIEDHDVTGFDIDTVRVGAAVAPADMTVTRASDFITLAIDGTGDQLSIRWQAEAGYAIEQVVFANGTLWDAATLEAIAVSNTNVEPTVAIALPDQTVNEDAAFSFVVPEDTFSDPGDALTLSATLAEGALLPAWISFDAASRTFSGTPGNADVGAFDVTVAATDTSGLSASDTFHLTVANTNDAPTVAKAISDQNATEDATFSFTVPTNTFADVDAGDTLTYSATLADGSALPAWLSFNAATRTFSGTPVNDDVGAFNMTVTVTDSEGVSVSDTFRLTVANTNDTPVLGHPIADQSASAGVAFDFTLATDAFRDIDRGDVLAHRATLANGDRLPAWLSFDAASRNFSGAPAASDIAAISIRVTASDLAGASATDDFQLVVSDGGKHHEANPVETDHYDDRGHDHGGRDQEHRRTSHGRKHFDRDDDRSDRKGYRITDCLAAYVESKPRYDFEALAHELERPDGHGEALNAQEIARRWRVVGQYASALSNEHEEDARGGADYHFNDLGLPGGGAFGGGFGYSGSIGALRRVANLQTLQGLEEGFQRLHA